MAEHKNFRHLLFTHNKLANAVRYATFPLALRRTLPIATPY
jgi:hypothetical protein